MMAEFVTTKELTWSNSQKYAVVRITLFIYTQLKSDIHPDNTLPTVLEIPITDTKKAASSVLIPSLKLRNISDGKPFTSINYILRCHTRQVDKGCVESNHSNGIADANQEKEWIE